VKTRERLWQSEKAKPYKGANATSETDTKGVSHIPRLDKVQLPWTELAGIVHVCEGPSE